MKRKIILSAIIFFFSATLIQAQNFEGYQAYRAQNVKRNIIREFISQFSLSFTLGYGRNFYSHKLPGYGVINKNDTSAYGMYIFDAADSANINGGVANWLNNPSSNSFSVSASDSNNIAISDVETMEYKGRSSAYPVTFSLHYNFLERFRIGGGFVYEFHRLPIMTPSYGNDQVGNYTPDKRTSGFKRYFGMVGGKLYEYMGWSYFLDFQFGKIFNYGNAFSGIVSDTWYFNLGVPIEYEFSEYFRVYLRPSYEFKNYTVATDIGDILHNHPALFVHFGFRYNIPEIPRCKIKSGSPPGYEYPENFTNKHCRIQKKHIHGNRGFRGQPFYKKQNPKVGENHPNLHKYKRFNLRKLNGGY